MFYPGRRRSARLLSAPYLALCLQVTTLDAQPSPSGGIICFVTGKLLVDGGTNPLM